MGRGLEADTSRSGRTLYGQVADQLEALVLAGPLGEETVLPPEWALAEQLAISRGTLRRALADLEERGLLRREAGRGTFVNPAARLRQVVWRQLAQVARPDSRFGYDFASFIPDFDGSDRCTGSIAGLAEYVPARTIVVTPDNNLESFRARALADGKRLLVCTYALARGFVLLDGSVVAASDRPLAATLDGMERFGPSLGYQDLCAVGRVDLVVTGAAAVTREGVHFGKGHGYFDIEWGLLSEIGLVTGRTPVVASVHSCQVVDESVPHAVFDATVDVIVTPEEITRCRPLAKPAGLYWERLPRDFADSRPYFTELRNSRGRRPGVA
jgi:5-formyltetrahydrofolate cyclo-ligase